MQREFNSLITPEELCEHIAKTIIDETIGKENIVNDDLYGTAREIVKSDYKRCLIILDSLDLIYYLLVMDELLAESEEQTSYDYLRYLQKLVETIIRKFTAEGGVQRFDIVLAIRTETNYRINSGRNSGSDPNPLMSSQANLTIELKGGGDEKEDIQRTRNIIKGRLLLVLKNEEIPKKAKDGVRKILELIDTDERYLCDMNRGMGYGLGLNGERDLIDKLRCISWSIYDDRFNRIFNNKMLCLLHYMLNEDLQYSQADKHMMNLFLVWNENRRGEFIGEYDVRIPKKWRAFHFPTYWLKYLVLAMLNKRPYSKIELKGDLSKGESREGYEKHLVELVLYSLQETSHGRFIRICDSRMNDRSTKLELTDRGKRFVENNVAFDFMYLAMVSEDRAMAIPGCFNYVERYTDNSHKKFIYTRDKDKFVKGIKNYVELAVKRVICFLYLLEKSLYWEKKVYKDAFRIIEKDEKLVLPKIENIKNDVIGDALVVYKMYGGEKKHLNNHIREANNYCYKNGAIIDRWYKCVYRNSTPKFMRQLIGKEEIDASRDLMNTTEFSSVQ